MRSVLAVTRRSLAIVLAGALIVAGCDFLPLGVPVLDRTGWRAVEVGGQVPVAGSEPTIAFADGRIAGTTGCNGYGGDIRIDGATLKIGEVAMTLMGCADRIGDIEQAFTLALASVDRAGLRPDGLLVLSGSAGDIVFRPDPTVIP